MEYQVISRKYRPKKFSDVFGQDAIVKTLKNAIKHKKLANAYLFSGSRGTGKTTLARIFAKAINCPYISHDFEPCSTCQTCKEIANGTSLDVLEIDGASNRGIDDIRKIKDNVGYMTASASYKIYIIDEVHMLTKEAFNALLKTLEEPPPNVKFIFATTELHKVLPTIVSRCQRFGLSRISNTKIKEKLQKIAIDLNQTISDEALDIIAKRAEGGLRDAESLLEQIISFHEGAIDNRVVADVLGIMSEDILFELDLAGKEGRFVKAFEIVNTLFAEGKDFQHFVEMLTEHYRNLLLIKLSVDSAAFLELQPSLESTYKETALLYTKEQLLDILDMLFNAERAIRDAPSSKVALEALLLRIMRTHRTLPIELLVKRLVELEHDALAKTSVKAPLPVEALVQEPKAVIKTLEPKAPEKVVVNMIAEALFVEEVSSKVPEKVVVNKTAESLFVEEVSSKSPEKQVLIEEGIRETHFYDTLLQFAAVELEGRLRRSQQFHDPKK